MSTPTSTVPGSRTQLAPPKAEAEVSLPSSLEGTPQLAPASDPSPVFEEIVSPSLEAADKGFDLDAPSAKPEWQMPECWGHRGASASFPENTRMSFIEACKAGADGIETDLHVSSDNEILCYHDAFLSGKTNGTGLISEQPWEGVLEHVRTKKAPHQPIPLFRDLIDILMMPSNRHVKVNIDCKVENNPTKLFPLIQAELEQIEDWEKVLAPRIILGLWHPKFLEPAARFLPHVKRYCISMSIPQAKTYFWDTCDGFSVYYHALAGPDGDDFRAECAKAGKPICTWTVNSREEMLQCARWGVQAIITDRPELWRVIKADLEADRAKTLKPTFQSMLLPYLDLRHYWFDREAKAREEFEYLEREGGKFDKPTGVTPMTPALLL